MAVHFAISSRKVILHDLKERNRNECDERLLKLFKSYDRLFESSETYRTLNNHLSVEVEKLRGSIDVGSCPEVPFSPQKNNEIVQLKQKLMKLQNELLENLRSQKQDAQQVSDLTNVIKQKEKEVSSKCDRIRELEERCSALESCASALEQQLNDGQAVNQCLKDELTALQMAYSSLETSFKAVDAENKQLVNELMDRKKEIAEFLDKEVENDRRLRERRIKEELIKAAKETIIPTGRASLSDNSIICLSTMIPKRPLQVLEAHEGEVTSVSWHANCRMFATGGADRKVKLWEYMGGKCEARGQLTGSNASVTNVEFEPEGNLVLASSNDFACRVWSCVDQRLKSTLTGHSGNVLSAKFLMDASRVVSGGKDRVIKLWDLRNIACLRSFFVGWTLHDLVVLDGSGIISGHFDNNIRMWDIRSDSNTCRAEILMTDKITSLDLSTDRNYLLCCTKDHHLSIIDMRTEKILDAYSAPGFHVSYDLARAAFSPDASYIAAGSSDGGVYVWDVAKKKLETVVKDHNDAVLAVAWSASGKSFVSCGKQKSVIFWSDI